MADLNAIYKSQPALWQKDTNPEGFSWLVGDDGASNVLAFTRWSDDGKPLVCITNFSPVPHENYSLPLPTAGVWREILNTDAVAYGGSGITNDSFAVDIDTDLKRSFRIPPLSTVWLERV
jgi:1,4-alpha-glucan branching enzyme